MSTKKPTRCPGCEKLEKDLAAVKAQVEDLQRQLAAARKNSQTSSLPPSSDIVKPPKPDTPADGAKRKIGGQHGHDKHERALFPQEALSGPPIDHRLEHCPGCGGCLQPVLALAPRIIQQVELLDVPVRTDEHRCHAAFCPGCGVVSYAPFPVCVEEGGLVGPRLTALIAYLKGACHASFSTIRKFLRDVAGVQISRGQLAKIITKVSEALKAPYEELEARLPLEDLLNVDETGHKHNKEQFWTWCFRASLYTLFKIDPTRSADVLLRTLGEEFDGLIGCDCFSAYQRFMRETSARLQLCLAHLIRDVKYLTTLSHKIDKGYGEVLLWSLRKLFKVIHARDTLSEAEFTRQLQAAKENVLGMAQFEAYGPESSRIAKRFEQYGESYFTFITTPGMEPTNNAAEQAIRFVVIDRKVTQGTRSDKGDRWCERIWTVMATCARTGASVFAFLADSVQAYFTQQPGPSLLPSQG